LNVLEKSLNFFSPKLVATLQITKDALASNVYSTLMILGWIYCDICWLDRVFYVVWVFNKDDNVFIAVQQVTEFGLSMYSSDDVT